MWPTCGLPLKALTETKGQRSPGPLAASLLRFRFTFARRLPTDGRTEGRTTAQRAGQDTCSCQKHSVATRPLFGCTRVHVCVSLRALATCHYPTPTNAPRQTSYSQQQPSNTPFVIIQLICEMFLIGHDNPVFRRGF